MFNSSISEEYGGCTAEAVRSGDTGRSESFTGHAGAGRGEGHFRADTRRSRPVSAFHRTVNIRSGQATEQLILFTAWLQNMFVPDEV